MDEGLCISCYYSNWYCTLFEWTNIATSRRRFTTKLVSSVTGTKEEPVYIGLHRNSQGRFPKMLSVGWTVQLSGHKHGLFPLIFWMTYTMVNHSMLDNIHKIQHQCNIPANYFNLLCLFYSTANKIWIQIHKHCIFIVAMCEFIYKYQQATQTHCIYYHKNLPCSWACNAEFIRALRCIILPRATRRGTTLL